MVERKRALVVDDTLMRRKRSGRSFRAQRRHVSDVRESSNFDTSVCSPSVKRWSRMLSRTSHMGYLQVYDVVYGIVPEDVSAA